MRKIVAALLVPVDGVVEAPEAWTGPYFSPQIGQATGSLRTPRVYGVTCWLMSWSVG